MKKTNLFMLSFLAVAVALISVFIAGCGITEEHAESEVPGAIIYTVTYYDDGQLIYTQSVAENNFASPPDKDVFGYADEVSWYSDGEPFDFTQPVKSDLSLTAVYDNIYIIEFFADGTSVYKESYSVYNKDIYVPEVPEKFGYTAKWEYYELSGGDLTVNAVYTPIEYRIEFYAEGKYADTVTCTIVNFEEKVPAVPQKFGYCGAWNYRADGDKYVAEAVYELEEFTVNFYARGELVDSYITNIENTDSCVPAIPEKYLREHYTAKWGEIDFSTNPVDVNLCYIPIKYTLSFVAENYVYNLEYTVESTSLTAPDVPAKDFYTGEWESFAFDFTDRTVKAIYEPIVYKVEFYADGTFVDVRTYTVLDKVIELPAVPQKFAHSAKWSEFALTGGDLRVDAVYERLPGSKYLEYDVSSDEYAVVTGYSGTENTVVIPSEYGGLPVTHIAENAFKQSSFERLTAWEGLQYVGDNAFLGNTYIQQVELPAGLKAIGQGAFQNCSALKGVKLPVGLESIGENAFSNSGITEIYIPNGIKVIQSYTFYSCDNLVSVEMGDSVETVKEFAFGGCSGLQSVKFGKGLGTIEAWAFISCEGLQYAELYEPEAWYDSPKHNQTSLPALIAESPEKAAYVIYKYSDYSFYKKV